MRLGFVSLLAVAGLASAQDPNSCPSYKATNVKNESGTVTADLTLNGNPCNIYGDDLKSLKLLVEYQTEQRLHVKIYDAEQRVYQLPESNLGSPGGHSTPKSSELEFSMTEDPFTFAVTRNSNGQVLFNTSGQALVFETQYLRIRTSLPDDPNIYGLGENADPFRHDPSNYSHTIWNSGEAFVPQDANLYGAHPIYYDHRGSDGTSAVFFRNSNGQRINLGADPDNYLEWNTIGGVFDFYYLSGPTPKDVSMQYADVVGHPSLMPYWGFGFHQCKYGYQDVYETAGVVANYSAADIPLETMWNDIDYMDYRGTFSLDPYRFPLDKMRQMIDYLHSHGQNYIMMVDPAVASRDYKPFHDGVAKDAFLKLENGSLYTGVVWPGPTNFPDWYAPNTQAFWNEEFDTFFNGNNGVDIDGLWIDMNEASSFCDYPCTNPANYSIENNDPPRPPAARMYSPYKIPGFPSDFQPHCFVTVNFTVDAQTDGNEVVLILGNSLSMGYDTPYLAPQLSGSSGNWTIQVQLPAKSNISYTYPRYSYQGEYILDPQNRSVKTGACGSFQVVNDHLDSSIPTKVVPVNITNPMDTNFSTQQNTISQHARRQTPGSDKPGSEQGLPGRNLINASYDIHAYFGPLSSQSIPTNLYHANGLAEYDVHNLFGSMMGDHSRTAMLTRRPGMRPLIITRSTFAGDGKRVGHWFGDNASTDDDYRLQISQMMRFVSLYQLPMVGSDVCGFNDDTNPILCARWAVLGAWNPFYRNHADQAAMRQEFFLWPIVAEAARGAISTRYRLLDYMYTNFYTQNQTGFPMLTPLLWQYPEDTNVYSNELQFFHGEALMVSPVTSPNSTSVTFYMPKDLFYDFDTFEKVQGTGANVTRNDVSYSQIPVHIRGGNVLPMRIKSAMTTNEVRQQDFELIIAPGTNGKANGTLYLDDGESVIPQETSLLEFTYANGKLVMDGHFGYNPHVKIAQITLLDAPRSKCKGYNATSGALVTKQNLSLMKKFSVDVTKC